MTATVFNIQKFSLHDGPGIRTTIFFKGCNLNCKWCANPESQRNEIETFNDTSLCTYCGACVNKCVIKARKIINDKLLFCKDKCRYCLECIKVCKNGAITLVGKKYTIDELLFEIKKDIVFYDKDGGVTLSGGEIFIQYDFILELCKALQLEKIHIVIETSGFTSLNKFKEVAKYCDLIYIDLKHYNNEKHIEGTGVPLFPIINNIQWMIENNIRFIVRIPVIPNYNYSIEDAKNYAKLLTEMKVNEVQLLPFHSLGEKKYNFLARQYAYENISSLTKNDLIDYQNVLIESGVTVTNGAS